MGSPIIALTLPDPFDKYIFCEERPELMAGLKARVERVAPTAGVTFVPGVAIPRSTGSAPRFRRLVGQQDLEPVSGGPVRFRHEVRDTAAAFAVFIDFVVLLAIGMDANRNYDHYVDGHSTKIDEALGNTEWRERWKAVGVRRSDFRPFLASEFP